MRGSVYKRGSAYTYVLDIGKIDGKRKQRSKGGFKTKKEAEKALADVLSTFQTEGRIFETKKITYSELFKEFLFYEGKGKRSSTILKYNSVYDNHLKDLIGHKYISNITAHEIVDYLLSLKLSTSYISSIKNQIYAVFQYAIRRDYIKSSPVNTMVLPKIEHKEIVIYSDEDLKALYKRLESTNLQLPFFIALNTGVRAGECYGLTWDDINFKKSQIRISKQLEYENNVWTLVPLKTEKGYRTIDMSKLLSEYLEKAYKLQEVARKTLGEYFPANKVMNKLDDSSKPYVCSPSFVNLKENGEFLNTYSHKVASRIAKTEMNLDFKFHNLRHCHASMLLDQGYSINYVQERLGHAKPSITWDIYSHLIKGKSFSLDKMDDLIANKLNLR